MPKKTIWVREGEDLEIWDQLYSPQWLHDKLQAEKHRVHLTVPARPYTRDTPVPIPDSRQDIT